jgi:hypothetical protein
MKRKNPDLDPVDRVAGAESSKPRNALHNRGFASLSPGHLFIAATHSPRKPQRLQEELNLLPFA